MKKDILVINKSSGLFTIINPTAKRKMEFISKVSNKFNALFKEVK